MKLWIWLIVLSFWAPLRMGGTEAGTVSISLRDVGWIMGLSPSPVGKQIAAYKVGIGEEGEYVTGYPLLIDLSESSRGSVKTMDVPGRFMDGTRPVWTRDGKSVYFLTDRIYKISANGSKIEALPVEADDGLALSPSGRRLAFWRRAPEDNRVLVVYDLAEQKEIRTWPVPQNYASESYGFDIAFGDEDRLYAQTYDEGLEEVHTPLKRFDVVTGTIAKIEERCAAVVRTESGVYYVAHDLGWKHFQIKRIMKVGNVTRVRSFKASLYVGLSTTGRSKWLVVTSQPKNALLNIATNQIVNAVKGCDSITMLTDGRVIYGKGGKLSTNEGICK